MNFEPGKFYMHDKGRCIAILGTVKSFKWGEMLIIEETDTTGHAMSCVSLKEMGSTENWVEIGQPEFLRNFSAKVYNGLVH